eukprot:GHVN01003160.1.p1 GENE.GHVN01003160.1~~GHVN01003160.1.p1  ORF type:complete len:785 (-),score=73.09 GHVN01003160.1:691-3045(-)
MAPSTGPERRPTSGSFDSNLRLPVTTDCLSPLNSSLSGGSHDHGSPKFSPTGALMQRVAKLALREEDPWIKHNIQKHPAELIKRHQWMAKSRSWKIDESIVKMEDVPFDKGAMRQCYRMKKLREIPPDCRLSFHRVDWNRSSNYVAKCYITSDGSVNTDPKAKNSCFEDIKLQYEAAHWADVFNAADPPKKINIIRAYAVEFVNRPGSPVFAVERFLPGKDAYGMGFVKHNGNSGYVDSALRRLTPQLFSAFSFYASKGEKMVCDIQGVDDLYTDPQVHSRSCQFGSADLGTRGMALFFVSFKHDSLVDAMGLPVFALSASEIKRQDMLQIAEQRTALKGTGPSPTLVMVGIDGENKGEPASANAFVTVGVKRERNGALEENIEGQGFATRDNHKFQRLKSAMLVKKQKRQSMVGRMSLSATFEEETNSSQETEVGKLLKLGLEEADFSYLTPERTSQADKAGKQRETLTPRGATLVRMGEVHYEIASLHGQGRFAIQHGECIEAAADDCTCDVQSCLFHLCHASSMGVPAASYALGRLCYGMPTSISPSLSKSRLVPENLDLSLKYFSKALIGGDPAAEISEAAAHPLKSSALAAGGLLLNLINANEGDSHVGEHVVKHHGSLRHLHETILDISLKQQMESREVSCSEDVEEHESRDGSSRLVSSSFDSLGSDGAVLSDTSRMRFASSQGATSCSSSVSTKGRGCTVGVDEDAVEIDLCDLRAKLGELLAEDKEYAMAAEMLNLASEDAIECGKFKLGTKLAERASELECLAEEHEGETGEIS